MRGSFAKVMASKFTLFKEILSTMDWVMLKALMRFRESRMLEVVMSDLFTSFLEAMNYRRVARWDSTF